MSKGLTTTTASYCRELKCRRDRRGTSTQPLILSHICDTAADINVHISMYTAEKLIQL